MSYEDDARFSRDMHKIAYRDYLCHWWHTERQEPLVGKTRKELDIFFAVDAALPGFRYQFRFRRPDKLKYDDLTIRAYRLHSLSELYKLNPLLKYFVYDWAAPGEQVIAQMHVCYMEPLLEWLREHADRYPAKINRDHSSAFKPIPFRDLAQDIIAFSVDKADRQLSLFKTQR